MPRRQRGNLLFDGMIGSAESLCFTEYRFLHTCVHTVMTGGVCRLVLLPRSIDEWSGTGVDMDRG